MEQITRTQAIMTLIQTLPPVEKKVIYVWMRAHKNDFGQNEIDQTTDDEDSDFWVNASSVAIEDIWGDPTEDVWDGIFEKRLKDGKLQAI